MKSALNGTERNAYFWGFLGVRLIGRWLHFRKRSIGLRVLQHSVFIQVPPPHPVEGSSAECWSYRCTHGSSKLIPPWINWLITTFEFLNSLFLWAPPFQVSVGFCLVDCKKRQVWKQLSSMNRMLWDPREVWGFALGKGGPKGVVHSHSESIISSWKAQGRVKGGAHLSLVCVCPCQKHVLIVPVR